MGHEIPILVAAHKLTPLGEPAPNAPKWFAAVEIIRLAIDKDWLHTATKVVSKYWRQKRERKKNGVGRWRKGERAADSLLSQTTSIADVGR